MKVGVVQSSSLGEMNTNTSVLQAHKVWVVYAAPSSRVEEPELLMFRSPPRYMPKKPSARAVFIRQSVLEAEARKEVGRVQVGLFPFLGTPQLALFSRSLPAFISPTNTYIPLYTSFPCWFWSRVLARSMGNTQVTPTRPATPPLRSFAVMLGRGEEKKRKCEKVLPQQAWVGDTRAGPGRENQGWQLLSFRLSRMPPPQHPPSPAVRSCPLLPHRLGTSLQEAHAYLPARLTLTHSEGFTELRYCRPAGKGAHQGVGRP